MAEGNQMQLDYHLPTRIVFGVGTLERLGELCRPLGRRALLVTMPEVPHGQRAAEMLEGAGIEAIVFDEAEANPRASSADAAGGLARETGCEFVVGLGGGSAMDAAKAAAVAATNAGPIWEYTIEYRGEQRAVREPPLPIVAIPTTAGTGSEVNGIAVLSNEQTRQKGPMRSPAIAPRIALIDPALTTTLPAQTTASTGFDAFTHAFERYLGGEAHPFIDLLAEDAMRTVVTYLPRALARPDDLAARSRMSWAATQAAMCVVAPLGEAGLHIFGLPISAVLDAPHGETLAAMLPAVLTDLAEAHPDKCARLAQILGGEARPEACVGAAGRWLASIGMRMTLRGLGATEEHCRRLADSVNMDRLASSYCKRLTREDVQEMYRAALE